MSRGHPLPFDDFVSDPFLNSNEWCRGRSIDSYDSPVCRSSSTTGISRVRASDHSLRWRPPRPTVRHLQVYERGGSRFTAPAPCGRQEQGSAGEHPRADESSRVTVGELMELEVGKLQRSRGGVAHDSHSLCRCRRLPFRPPWRRTIDAPCSVWMSPHSSESASRPGGPGDGASIRFQSCSSSGQAGHG